ncbi:hypothetical protein JDV02_008392 [Purpureocillium takamizusanense]|uniref:Ankyrin repeat protein n=1 Tax=Purpureocillium takamizusanense TaxID=2060973 RepID=A0A9Q8QMP5_9HYPO|nr:uncharacterized protein JDV02_008392 [Purpureocillium takamizusanense]UNI22508.1 hypothetical protein JDV02_008392 [Purpureocillium takamizusanense]
MDLVPSMPGARETALLNAAQDGELELVRDLLSEHRSLVLAKEPTTGRAALHLAVINGHASVVQLLLESGANVEAADGVGWPSLALAATVTANLRSLAIPRLLLEYGANVEAVNASTLQSALYLCADADDLDLAQLLLDNGAQVDFRDIYGWTPLLRALVIGSVPMTRLLLQYGADKDVTTNDGHTAEGLARSGDIIRILRATQLLRGPDISGPGKRPIRRRTLAPAVRVPPQLEDIDKQSACHAFKISVVEFFIGDSEERIHKTASVYDMIYGIGANAIMNSTRQGIIDAKPAVRWYHLPANNAEWVEDLARRHLAEGGSATGLTDVMKSDLGMSRALGDYHIMQTTQGCFNRPLFHATPADRDNSTSRVTAFVPYLHYETQGGFKAMSESISRMLPVRRRAKKTAKFNLPERESDRDQDRADTGATVPDTNPRGRMGTSQPPNMAMYPGALHELLLKGYFKSAAGSVPPLQARRTLDQYFYTHLGSTAKRDVDQVVLRYTSKYAGVEPKIFMVDQLWLWLLDDETIISCCPMRWDSWTLDVSATGTHPTSWDDFKLRDGDPLNIYQAILRYLRDVRRPSITSAHDLCLVITSFCLGAFDPLGTTEDFHFFDFMERSIGEVSDQTAESLREFRELLDATALTKEFLSAEDIRIEQETNLLVEIEDIRDELGILRSVLCDQNTVIQDLFLHLETVATNDPNHTTSQDLRGKRVLNTNLARLDRMESLTTKAVQSLRTLLELKQQHASLSEAQSARRQTEHMAKQASLATTYNRKVANQISLARRQAEETARQGNVILLFTVVTVVFLPLSFITSFFTVPIAAFPYNDKDKMPVGFVLAIILSVSAGVSVPFVLVAFNLESVKSWPKSAITWVKGAPFVSTCVGIILLVTIVALAATLSQPLAPAVKAGVGVGLALLAMGTIVTLLVSRYGRGRRKGLYH